MATSMDALPIDDQYMPHEAHMRRNGEDWSGITDQKERKKLQNRLNQRAREYMDDIDDPQNKIC